MAADPLEERDIVKFLDALDEPRVQEKLVKLLTEKIIIPALEKKEHQNANPKT